MTALGQTALGQTALGQTPVAGALQGKPLSAKERRRRRRARARAKAKARARAKAAKARAAAKAKAEAAAKAKADAAAKAKADAAAKAAQQAMGPVPTLSSLDRHFVDRFTFGYSRDTARQVAAAGGGRAWFERQLSPAAIADPVTAS
ncbi:hypothetical protein, partial [Solicola sp. PLA-1-18]|uniref:hypothetical protein n=1 Tax=Solicola sp. PLA-1-18 TaxID=3380532 RepID=UPI003B7C841C